MGGRGEAPVRARSSSCPGGTGDVPGPGTRSRQGTGGGHRQAGPLPRRGFQHRSLGKDKSLTVLSRGE